MPEHHPLAADSNWQVVVIGAGAAGLVAAERAASRGLKTLLLERNRKPGVKILMSGGTRCNLTQNTDCRGIVAAYGPPGRFLHSALAALGPQELVALVEGEGVPTKIEETGKIFPVSDKATDVLQAFMERLHRSGCELALEESLIELERIENSSAEHCFRLSTSKRTLTAGRVIITTGGQSYPGSGTTGDGYHWAAAFGHTIVPPRPALVPITTSAPWVRKLSGITIPDVALRLLEPDPNQSSPKQKILDIRRGSLLFTHFGLSGPVVLDISRHVSGHPQPQTLQLECDFLPDIKLHELDHQLHQQAVSEGKKQLLSLVPEVLPRRLAEVLLQEVSLPADKKAGELSNANRAALLRALKQLPISVTGTRGFAKAEVTAGGVRLDEIDSSTLESKLVPGLYFAGEVLDLDGPIGGYNFQAAFSTGWLAGMSV
ncbi:MAG TPA: NAD(P)/FAD-dependent oxidoreductase [Pirellulales bacterium]|nr:NAD(P)/FAD-dependent oxidoreductase [Pirellulales bacterium]